MRVAHLLAGVFVVVALAGCLGAPGDLGDPPFDDGGQSGGGSGGGTIVAEGPPEHVATVTASYTGHYLKPLLDPKR